MYYRDIYIVLSVELISIYIIMIHFVIKKHAPASVYSAPVLKHIETIKFDLKRQSD